MKILAFTDLHGDMQALEKVKQKAEEADVIVSTGDLTVFEKDLETIMSQLDSLGKPVIIVHGNHEFYDNMEQLSAEMENVKFIHEEHHEHDDALFLGYGGGGFSYRTEEFKEVGEKFKKLIGDHDVIFLIHGPPYDTDVDIVMEDHVGNMTMREFIEEVEPDMVVCGHIHEAFGKEDRIGKSHIINPGPEGKIIEI